MATLGAAGSGAPLPVANGGTGSATAALAGDALGVVRGDGSGGETNLRIIRGIVDTTSTTPVEGTGFTIAINSTGNVTITFSTAFSDVPMTQVGAVHNSAGGVRGANIDSATAPSASVVRLVRYIHPTTAVEDGVIHFVSIGPR